MWVFLSLKLNHINILHSASLKCKKGNSVVFVPHIVFLHSKSIFSINFYLVWLSVIWRDRRDTYKELWAAAFPFAVVVTLLSMWQYILGVKDFPCEIYTTSKG